MHGSVTISPVALASILDAHLRRLEIQDRAIGILLGHRASHGNGATRIVNALGLPYAITRDNLLHVDFEDLENDKTVSLLQKAHAGHGDEQLQVVGWYATAPDLNSYTPLVNDQFAKKMQQIASTTSGSVNAFQSILRSTASSGLEPIHLTLDPETLSFATYIAAPMGLSAGKPQNALFVPTPNELELSSVEGPALDMILATPASTSTLANPTPLHQFSHLLSQVSKMLDSVLSQVNSILDGSSSAKIDPKLATLLMDALSHISLPQSAAEKEKWDEEFEAHLADILMLSYLANLAKYQMDLAARLALLPEKGSSGADFGPPQAPRATT